MGKNLDTDNIFGSYLNNVILKEAVKPTETSGIEGSWSGNSYGESISVKFGSNGSAILTNSAGANSGTWSSQDSDSFSVNFGNQLGRMVLVDSSTASLTIGGNSIELKRGGSSVANTPDKTASPEPENDSTTQTKPAANAKLTINSSVDDIENASEEDIINLINSL